MLFKKTITFTNKKIIITGLAKLFERQFSCVVESMEKQITFLVSRN